MAIPDLHGSDHADICLMHSARIRSANTKTEIRFETKVAHMYVAKTLLLICSSGLGEMGYLKGTDRVNNLTLSRFAFQTAQL